MYKYRFSIFTATYNRGNLLRRRYEELLALDFKNFEWIIVSDGSTDNTVQEVNSFIEEKRLSIKFVDKENGGKHTAWKVATPLFEGRYVLTIDDDDIIPPDTLSLFDKYWRELECSPVYDSFWEVRSRCSRADGSLIGEKLPAPYFDSDYNAICYVYKNYCEMDGCRKVEILRNEAAVPDKFLFHDKVSNFPESIRWSRAARVYKTRFVPDITRIYLTTEGSLCASNKGGGRNMRKTYNTIVGAYYTLKEQRDLMYRYDIKKYLMTIAVIVYNSFNIKRSTFFLMDKVNDKLLYLLFYLPMLFIWTIRK